VSRRTRLWLTGGIAVALFVVLAILDNRMQTAGEAGIIDFELAGSADQADRIREKWGETGRDAALASLLLDYPFLLAYGAFGIVAVSALRDRAPRWGAVAFAAACIGPASDAVENGFLLASLSGGTWAALPATVFALLKFAALIVSGVFVLAMLARRVVAARSR